jgi:hypothetical protein
VFNTRYEFICQEQEAALLQGITLAELQQFYAAHLAPSSVQRRKLTVQVIPKHNGKSSAAAQGAGEDGKPQEQQAAPHVQHEHGMLEPISPRQAGLHVVGATVVHAGVSGAAEQQSGEADVAAAVGSPSSRQMHAKRQRRQQKEAVDAAAEGDGAAADASALLPAGVQLQLLADPVQFKQSRERYPVYCTVKPQLAQQQ